MAYFGLGGQFGSWLDNPNFMNPDFLGFRGSKTGMVKPVDLTKPRTAQARLPGYGTNENSLPAESPSSGNKWWESIPGFSQMASDTRTAGEGQTEGVDEQEFYRKLRLEQIAKGQRPKLDLFALFDRFGGGKGNVPEKWDGGASIAKAKVDPMAVIAAHKPGIMEQMNRGFANAAMRQGATGALMGSGYSKALGGEARKAANDIGQITMDTLFKSSESAADREQQALESARDRSLSAWGTHGNWVANKDREYFNNLMGLLGLFGGNIGNDYNIDMSGFEQYGGA